MATIQWFGRRQDFVDAASRLQDRMEGQYVPVAGAAAAEGRCPVCERPTTFVLSGSSDSRPNLRENLHCPRCHLNSRQRLVFVAMRDHLLQGTGDVPPRGALLEQTTRLYRRAHHAWPWLTGSEFLGDQRFSGRHYWWSTRWWRWRHTRHESITSLSYATDSLGLLVHSDVLEHVYDTPAALRESSRVLRPGGVTLFTVPFFVDREQSLLRGRPAADGQIEHLAPPEYHGDGLRHGGIYTFHHFGWDLIERMRDAGFSRAQIGFCHAPGEGFHPDDPAATGPWQSWPLLFRAVK
ncbi:methyltransferase domain-containing protein [Dyella soli]|uniref:Methyltransferase domain-containing protein n=1 Tax=Dyella soli TaxID=522319 RepID=A0A4R0YQ07_9GAMM|nr:methyltransferase domain-containing protein [Dyella soli]TCI06881.1 methyltransferase domain-containing protein [Dyella soli]